MSTSSSAAAFSLLLLSAASVAVSPCWTAPRRSRPPTAGASGRAPTASRGLRAGHRPDPRRPPVDRHERRARALRRRPLHGLQLDERTGVQERQRVLARDRPRWRLWAGTEGAGLVRYRDGVVPHRSDALDGLTNLFVRALFEDRDGRLWVGTDDGLFRLEGDVAPARRRPGRRADDERPRDLPGSRRTRSSSAAEGC